MQRIRLESANHRSHILFGVIGILGFLLIWTTTAKGVEVGHDASRYIFAARGVISGIGFSQYDGGGILKPFNHFPPLYPLLLAIPSIVGVDPLGAARLIAAIIFGANIYMISLLLYQSTASVLFSLLGGLMVLTSPVMFDQHVAAMSEPLYFLLLLLLLYSIVHYSREEKKIWLLLSGFFTALAYLTRYIGISLAFSGCLMLLMINRENARCRIKQVVTYLVISIGPILPWYIRNYSLTGSINNRVSIFHPISILQLKTAFHTISAWLSPNTIPNRTRAIALLFLAAGLIFLRIRRGHIKPSLNKPSPLLSRRLDSLLLHDLALISAVTYGVFVIISVSFFDAASRLTDRILSPLFIPGVIICVIAVYQITGNLKNRTLSKWIIALVIVFFLSAYSYQTWAKVVSFREYGRAFTSREWVNSPTVEHIRKLSPEVFIYSNEMYALDFLADRPVYSVPEKVDPVKEEERENYEELYNEMMSNLWEGKAVLVIFPPINKRPGLPTMEEVTSGLVMLDEFRDGQVYAIPGFSQEE